MCDISILMPKKILISIFLFVLHVEGPDDLAKYHRYNHEILD